jgi:predicted DNA-binding transcriptional regulator AlpA
MSGIGERPYEKDRRGIPIMPRVLRLRDAPRYLGMNRNLFNSDVRPFLSEVRIGRQGVAFDRLELDAWWEQYQSRNERRPKALKLEDDTCQNVTECRGSAKKA